MIPAVALGLGACNKKQEAKAPEAPAAVAESPGKGDPEVPPPAPVVPKVSAEERAAKLGFVKHLPQDTEVVLAFHNGSKIANRVKGSKLWNLVEEQMGGGMIGPDDEEAMNGEDEDAPDVEMAEEAAEEAGEAAEAIGEAVEEAVEEEVMEEAGAEEAEETPELPPGAPEDEDSGEASGPAALFGTEFTLALGKSTGDQAGNLLTLNRRMGYFQMRSLARSFAAAMKSGDVSSLEDSLEESYGPELAKDLLKDPQSGIALLEKAKMPPVYLAFRSSEAERPAAAQQVAAMVANVGMLGEMIEPVTVEVGGNKFEGSKILGAKISAAMAEDREEMEEMLDAATVDQVLAIVAKKDLVVVSGTVGDYVLLFIGGSTDDLKLASDLGQSIVTGDALAFSDAYVSKDLAALVYGQKEALDTVIKSAGGLSEMTNGLRDGLAGAEGLGDTRDLEAMFQIVAERETALRKLAGNDASGTIAFFEDGLKIESFGGPDSGMLDWKAANKLGHLGKSEDVVLFANFSADAVYDEKARAYGEALMETAYALTMKVAEAPMENEDMAQFKEMAKLFDAKFRPDMVALWDAFSNDFRGSLGKESALVVDLKGGAPSVPGIPAPLLEKAKIPRVSFLSPVTDRAKLSGSWDKMNTTVTGTLAKVSEMVGQEIPMQKPMSSERSGNTTWFFPMPFLTDDFVPSVTVGDKWFAVSTSKNQALDLISKADGGSETSNGFHLSLNFRTLEKYANETYQLVDENAEEVMGSPLPAEEKKIVKDSIAILGDLDKLTIHSRREGAVLRSSVHFKTR